VTPDPTLVAAFAAAHAAVLGRIASASARVGRDPADVMLVAVSKTVASERLRAAVAAGLTTLGENRVQEAVAKTADVPGASWHLVGHLQGNKARQAVATFDVVQSVDSIDLAGRLDRIAGEGADEGTRGRRLAVLVQVNVDEDTAKAGFAPDALPGDLPAIVALPNLDVRGLMTVGRLVAQPADARATFVRLRRLGEDLRRAIPELGPELSMGMSDDFELAIEEGATIVRVGRALFGERPHVHGPGDAEHVHAMPDETVDRPG
jgi:hypothetical protein